MAFAVVRGDPSAAQRHLDGVLDRILAELGVEPSAARRASLSLAQVLFYCMKAHADQEFMTNGMTGEIITIEQILKYAVPLARCLIKHGAKGKTVLIAMRNHKQMVAVYFGVLFAGVVPFIMDPNGTAYEFKYFLELLEPCLVFCDREHYSDVTSCLDGNDRVSADVIVAEEELVLRQFIDGASDDLESFQVAASRPDDTVIMLPTSGSTGLPKAALLHNKGLVMQLPLVWPDHQFPTPTRRVIILNTSHWITFTMMVTTCVVYQVPLLMSPGKNTPEHAAAMFLKFQPSWAFFSPQFAKILHPILTPKHFSALDTLLILGAPLTPTLISALKEKLPVTTHLCDGYGSTETHGTIAFPDRGTPHTSNGRVCNIFHYKLVNEDGQDVGPCHKGELYVKSDSCIKGYYKSESFADSCTSDGWYKTGDVFYIDENKRMYYREKKKFSFKYYGTTNGFARGYVSPEEVECVISSVAGVRECVVCGTDRGPTAAVVLQHGCDVTRQQIHFAVNSTLSDHKRLRGGIAFVTTLPQTSSGKLRRDDCLKLLKQLMESGQCF